MKRAALLSVKISAYQRLSRTPIFQRKGSSRLEDIADSWNGMQHRLVRVRFAAQTVHQHVQYVGLGIEAVIEDVFEDHRFCDRPIGVAHEVFEQRELARLQLDALCAPSHLPS